MSAVSAILDDQPSDAGGHEILVRLLGAAQVHGAGQLAGALLAEFGTLAAALSADVHAQKRVIGNRPEVVRCLALVRSAMLHVLATEVSKAPVLDNHQAVVRYLHAAMAHQPREQIRALFLDVRHGLIRDEVVAHGTVTSVTCEPREIMRRALEVGAVGLVLAHNHPSGSPEPSREDIQVTRRILDAGRALGVVLHDHIIVARNGHLSFRSQGYCF